MTNAGSSAAAEVVLGAPIDHRGDISGFSGEWRATIGSVIAQPSGSSYSPAVGPPNAVEWECGLSRQWSHLLAGASGRTPAMFPARQWGLVDVAAGGAGDHVTTKGLTGSLQLSKSCAGEGGQK